ncbi:CoA-transferase [bacterium]
MKKDFDDIIKKRFLETPECGPSKVMPLGDAITKFIKPGMTIHTGVTHFFSYCGIFELIRRFQGTDAGFEVISLGSRTHGIWMIRTGILKKLISTFVGDVYPSPGPNPVYNKAYLDGTVEFESWTVLTLPMRLKAAAMGLSCTTTNSIIGSGMEEENTDSFQAIDDPFNPGKKIGLLKALVPDISIIHGVAADEYGNTLFTAPYAEGLWGEMAAREGTIVTVEKIVSTDYIREHSYFCKLPGSFVRSVSVVPYGAHPNGMKSFFMEGMPSFAEDYDWVEEFYHACRDEKKLDDWMNHWILDCAGPEEYLEKIGPKKISFLIEKADENYWKSEIESKLDKIESGPEYNDFEWMIVTASKILKKRIVENGYKRILAGIGMSNLAAWMACYDLKRDGVEISLVAETGFVDYLPRPADPFIFNLSNVPMCTMLTDTFHALGVMTTGLNNHCIGSLGAAQVDKFGNINSTKIPGKAYITGPGGANDVLSSACETMLVVPQGKRRQIEKVPHISGPGARAKTLITTMGVFEKVEGKDTFVLTAYLAQPGKTQDECIEAIRDNCGWELDVADELEAVQPPELEELRFLRLFDPDRHFLGDLNK